MTTTIFKRRLVPLLLAAGFGAAVAAPTGQQVVAGQATFSQQGNVFSITNTPGTIINWQSFSINAGEVTRFIQQSADSAVLNRIVGQDPSRILGALQSNGKVFLINPNGVMFGRDARVDVNGLVASTLNLSDADFLAGKKNFTAGAVAGAVRNEGAITTPSGGQVFLVAPDVSNAGVITSPQGEVVLAAGHRVQLVDSRDPDLNVVVAAPNDQSINLGKVVAQGGGIGIYGALVSQRGLVSANSAQVGADGKIVLRASRATTLENGSVTTATGAGSGGAIELLGETVALNGNAQVIASGATGGGTVLAGGDWQGKNAALPNARQALLGKDASIRADALVSGDGGKVVLWSDDSTSAYGSISARGAGAGNGGRVETSGHSLDIAGIKVNAGAARGKAGTWLLDPYDIEVVTAGATTSPADAASAGTGPSTGVAKVAPSALVGTGTNIMLEAQHDITITDAITTANSVTASAGNDINVNAPVTSTAGDLAFHANNAFNLSAGVTLKSNNYIDLIANQMSLSGTIGSAGGQLPIITFNPASDSRQIQIGSGTPDSSVLWLDAGKLSGLSAFELNVGSTAHTGGIQVNAPLSQSANVVLDSAGPIAVNQPVTLNGASTSFVATLHGAPGMLLDVNGAITAGKLVQLTGDGLRISAPVTATNVTLAPHSATTPISLGFLDEGALSLDEAMLKMVNATNLTIGGMPGAVGSIQVAGPIDLSSHPFGTLTLDAGFSGLSIDAPLIMPSGVLALQARSGVSQGAAGALTVDKLAFTGGDVSLTGTNQIGTLAGTASGQLTINATGPLSIGQAGTQAGVSAASGGVHVMTDGALKIDATVAAPGDYASLEGNGISGSGTIQANTVELSSGAGIGTATAPLKTQAGMLLAANSNGGSSPINITNTGNLTVGALQQLGDPGTSSGSITLHTTGDLTVAAAPMQAAVTTAVTVQPASASVQSRAGSIDLSATGAMTISGAVVSDSGSISLNSGKDMTVSGQVSSNSGSLNLTAGSGARFTITAGASVSSQSGDITVAAGSTSIPTGAISGDPNKIHVPSTQPPPPPTPPGLEQCIATPAQSNCVPVLDAAKKACSADWNAGHCDQVMPAASACQADPAALGCAAVTAHNALLACVANPQGANCGSILPAFDSCQAKPGQLGCDAVLAQRARLDACIAAPSAAGCDAILPTYDQCQATPNVYGCGPAITQHDRVAACAANPTAACFDSTLPSYDMCQKAPGTFGCAPVTKRHDDIMACIVNPSGANCSAVLPSLTACHANAGVFGCAPVLAREQFLACVANASGPGCDAILPALSVCKATPAAEGCAQVLDKTFNFCLGSPNDASCAGVLPTISQCVADKSAKGCQVVLPTLAQCIGSPTLQGCSVILPALAQCAANPSLGGCEAVLPKPDFCGTHPTDPTCQVFNPTPASGTGGDAKAPGTQVGQTVRTTVTLINTSTSSTSVTGSTGGIAAGGAAGSGTSSSSGSSSDKPSDKQSDKDQGPAASENNGAKNEKPATKMYCN
jgi:filamentous hemagglutinin family protein